MDRLSAALLERKPDRPYEFWTLTGRHRTDWMSLRERSYGVTHTAKGVLEPGALVGIIAEGSPDVVVVLMAAWLRGCAVILLPLPGRHADLGTYAAEVTDIAHQLGVTAVVAAGELRALGGAESWRPLEELAATPSCSEPASLDVNDDDPAVVQLTSGTIGPARSVMVTRKRLMAHLDQIMERLELDPDRDQFASWLPPQHDMGLIGMTAMPAIHSLGLAVCRPTTFLKRPTIWLDMVEGLGATVTGAPNFAYALTERAMARSDQRWDLSRLRYVANGAEPVDAATVRRFCETAVAHRLASTAVAPVYGLAEATLAVTMPRPGEGLRLAAADAGEQRHVLCGTPLVGTEVRVHEDGELWVRGPSVAGAGWIPTGDLGFIEDGELAIVGRRREMVIVNGRNIPPSAVEGVVAAVPGIRRGNVAAVMPADGRKRVTVVAEISHTSMVAPDDTSAAAKAALFRGLGTTTCDVILVPAGCLPKTTSGKLQRTRVAAAVAEHGYREVQLNKQGRTKG